MKPVVLYQTPPSFYSQIARLTLIEKGVPWREHFINIGPMMENYEPWYMRINPKGVVPTLDHHGRIVTDAFRIMRYVEDAFGGPSLTPADPEQRDRMNEWIEILEQFPEREFSYGLKIEGWKGRILKRMMKFSYKRRRSVIRYHMARSPDLVEAYQFRLDDIDRWEAISSDPIESGDLQKQQIGYIEQLEQELVESPWYFGQQYTLIDLVWTIFLARLEQFGLLSDILQSRPRVRAYYSRLKSRPSFAEAEIWTSINPAGMFRILGPFLIPRVVGALAVISLFAVAIWLLVSGG